MARVSRLPGVPHGSMEFMNNATLETEHQIDGPWSLATSRRFWEGFSPSALIPQDVDARIHAVFLADADWQRTEVTISQQDDAARIVVSGQGDLTAATAQVLRFMSLDIDGRDWPGVADRDPIIADAQRRLPGFRPCGFFSPYEAAAWAVLSQRIQMRQAAAIKKRLADDYGDKGAFPAPAVLRELDLDLPGRKTEYLHAVAEAALEGSLSGSRLRALPSEEALAQVQQIKGLGPFAAELVVIRGANFPDVLPQNEERLNAEIRKQYGTDEPLASITEAWRPYRSWASVHLRALREERTHEISGGR